MENAALQRRKRLKYNAEEEFRIENERSEFVELIWKPSRHAIGKRFGVKEKAKS